MSEKWEFLSAVTLRAGIVAGGILGGLVGHWVGGTHAWPEQDISAWATAAGVVVGVAAAWVGLAWLARRHASAGVLVGAALTVAAAVALLVRFASLTLPGGG